MDSKLQSMRKIPFFIIIIYVCIGCAWLILGTEIITRLNNYYKDVDLRFLYFYKNLVFVLGTAALLYFMLQFYRKQIFYSLRNYLRIFEGNPNAMYVVDKHSYRFLAVNQKMIADYGYTKDELLKMTLLDIRPDQEKKRIQAYIDKMSGVMSESGVWIHQKKNKDSFYVLVSYHETIYKNQEAFMITAVNIDSSIKNENRISELVNLYETVTKATNDIIWDLDLVNNSIYWMQGFKETFGYKEEDIVHTMEWALSNIHPEDRDIVINAFELILEKKLSKWSNEYRYRCADGTYKYVFDRGYIIFSDEGKPLRVVGALRNIDVRKKYEQQLVKQNEQLQEIAWINSHEIRKPVSNILGLIRVIRANDHDEAAIRDMLNLLETSAQELDEVVQKINIHAKETSMQ